MRVLVTGATGFLGRALVEALRRRGHTVRALHRPATTPAFPADVELVQLDLRAPEGLHEALQDVDVVVHAAATKTGDFHDQFAGTVATTQKLFSAMLATDTRRIVLVSSFSVYDPEQIPAGQVLDERCPLGDPTTARDAYSATKLLQEELLEKTATDAGWSATVARPGVIFGPDNLWFERVGYRRGDRFWVAVGSRARLPLSHVENAADAIAHLAERTAPGIRVVNVVDDDPPTQREYRQALADRIGRPKVVVVLPWPVVHAMIGLLSVINRWLGSPLRLPGAFRLDAAVARWKQLEYSNGVLRDLGWEPRWRWPQTLDRSLSPGSSATTDRDGSGRDAGGDGGHRADLSVPRRQTG